jgi:hypothetical protein
LTTHEEKNEMKDPKREVEPELLDYQRLEAQDVEERKDLRRKALEVFERRKAGALLTEIGWVWKHQVRLSDDAAQAVLVREAELEGTIEDAAGR